MREVNFDLERMRKSIASGYITLPDMIGRKAFREWMRAQAAIIEARRK